MTTTAFNLAMFISNHDFHNGVRFSSRPVPGTKSLAEPLTKVRESIGFTTAVTTELMSTALPRATLNVVKVRPCYLDS